MNSEREQRDNAVFAEHKAVVAAATTDFGAMS
jgi:hypothetical protein